MGLGSVIRGGIATAKAVLGGDDGVLDNVTVKFWLRDTDEYGTPQLSNPVTFQAVVIRQQKLITKSDGQTAVSTSYIAFLEEIAPNGAAGRHEPLDERDVITLSDGTTGPILNITGLMDEGRSTPYLLEVYLG